MKIVEKIFFQNSYLESLCHGARALHTRCMSLITYLKRNTKTNKIPNLTPRMLTKKTEYPGYTFSALNVYLRMLLKYRTWLWGPRSSPHFVAHTFENQQWNRYVVSERRQTDTLWAVNNWPQGFGHPWNRYVVSVIRATDALSAYVWICYDYRWLTWWELFPNLPDQQTGTKLTRKYC